MNWELEPNTRPLKKFSSIACTSMTAYNPGSEFFVDFSYTYVKMYNILV